MQLESEIRALADQHVLNTYARYPLALVDGKGCTLFDEQGKSYTDFIAGIAVCNLGHAHPGLAAVLAEQAGRLWHVSNLFYTLPQAGLAAFLTSHSFADRVFFANSGAEANEAAIKLARSYFKDKGQADRYRIVCMDQSFHGRTMATLSATGQPKVQKGFQPLLQGFDFVPFNDIDALENHIGPATCAVMLEPVQAEGGVRCPSPEYLGKVRRLCDRTGCLLIFDEVQTGIGRTGKLFAHEHFGVVPDVMTLAKALGNGLPIGAMLATEKAAAVMGPGTHASTFGGAPLVSRVALEVLKIITEEQITQRAFEQGEYLRRQLQGLKHSHRCIVDVRGQGLLIGVELDVPGAQIVTACREKGYLLNCVQDNVLRLVPPLIVSRSEIDGLIQCLHDVLPT
jgi:acetylornithine aminotransferase